MKKIMLIFASIWLLGTFPKEKRVDKIIISYVDFEIETFYKITCDNYENSFNDIYKVEVIDSVSVNKIMAIIKTLHKDKDKSDPDTRVKLKILYNDNSCDSLCMDDLRINYNGKAIKYSQRLKNEILKIVAKTNKPIRRKTDWH